MAYSREPLSAPAGPLDGGDPVGFDTFRRIMGSFPTGVTLVTTLDESGRPRGVTVNAFASVSAEPPVLLISLARWSRSLAAILSHEAFVVHVLAEDAEDISRRFASPNGSFHGLDWSPSDVSRGAPVLYGPVVAAAECLVSDAVTVGDHTIVFGLVAGGWGSPDARPLLYHRGGYHDWAGQRTRRPSVAGSDDTVIAPRLHPLPRPARGTA